MLPASEMMLPLRGSPDSRVVVDLRRYHFDSDPDPDPFVFDTGMAAVVEAVLIGAGIGADDRTGGDVAAV